MSMIRITQWTLIRLAKTKIQRRRHKMELLVASAIGILTAAGLYLVLRLRTFPVIMGVSLLTYAVNVFLFASGRLTVGAPPILSDATTYTDPLPQALVLTAIVISFGMTAVVVMIALGAFLGANDDHVDDPKPEADTGDAS
jgi:multicomponent K+:H+ antiporter subunit C